MKRIITILISSLALISFKNENKPTEQTYKKEIIEQQFTFGENPELINDFYTNEYLDSISKTVNFENVEDIVVSYNGTTYKIHLQHIPDWNDPGDLLRVKITDKNEKVLLEKTNFSGWVKFGNNYTLPETVLAKNQIKSDKALLIDNNNGKQLILFGWAYASRPGLVTVINLFPKPRIIFNKEFKLKKITEFNDSGFRNLIGGTTVTNKVTLNMEKMLIE